MNIHKMFRTQAQLFFLSSGMWQCSGALAVEVERGSKVCPNLSFREEIAPLDVIFRKIRVMPTKVPVFSAFLLNFINPVSYSVSYVLFIYHRFSFLSLMLLLLGFFLPYFPPCWPGNKYYLYRKKVLLVFVLF